MRTFVVGDIHGYSQKLRKLLALLKTEAAPGDALVFVGDYIDRGPDTRGVIDLLLEQREGGWNGPVTTLMGNHEEMMLDAMSERPQHSLDAWFDNGGLETLLSYGDETRPRRWVEGVPPAHRELLEGLRDWHQDENGIYVHAGLQPGEPPEEASGFTLRWIREEFIQSDYAWEKVVVFGHTPQYATPAGPMPDRLAVNWAPLDRPEKIGIDTGAAYGGPLSAVLLPERRFFAAR